ncbi:MAG: hypothetical protein JJU21_05875 [Salinarimonas sp.]|nr:hypothetical protein [Salinarimonas sp.]
MAKGELVVRGDTNAAMQAFVNAVTYMGGSVTSMNPARPVEFRISRSANLGGYGAPYAGTATFVQMGPSQTKILVELNSKALYTGLWVAGTLAVITLGGTLAQDEETIMTITVILLPVVAIMLYFYYGPWRRQVIDKAPGRSSRHRARLCDGADRATGARASPCKPDRRPDAPAQ